MGNEADPHVSTHPFLVIVDSGKITPEPLFSRLDNPRSLRHSSKMVQNIADYFVLDAPHSCLPAQWLIALRITGLSVKSWGKNDIKYLSLFLIPADHVPIHIQRRVKIFFIPSLVVHVFIKTLFSTIWRVRQIEF